jgi:hypothetical protein
MQSLLLSFTIWSLDFENQTRSPTQLELKYFTQNSQLCPETYVPISKETVPGSKKLRCSTNCTDAVQFKENTRSKLNGLSIPVIVQVY